MSVDMAMTILSYYFGFQYHVEVRESLGATASCLLTSGRVGDAAKQRRALHARIGGNS